MFLPGENLMASPLVSKGRGSERSLLPTVCSRATDSEHFGGGEAPPAPTTPPPLALEVSQELTLLILNGLI